MHHFLYIMETKTTKSEIKKFYTWKSITEHLLKSYVATKRFDIAE